LTIQLSLATNDDVQTQKQCKDFFPQSMCDSLKQLAETLKESSTTVQDAINAGVKAHIQSSKEMLAFVRGYIAERIHCEQVLTEDMCTVLNALKVQLKLTSKQVGLAIEMAVNGTKATTKEIYQKVLSIIEEDINCELILGKQACDNMGSALDKFHEQRRLIKEAIMSVAMKHLKSTVWVLSMVQEELVTRIKNFNCNTVLPDVICLKITSVASRLKISVSKVREAIELAVMNGITSANAIYKFTIDFLTNQINCANILTPQACTNLLEASKKLHEQSKLVQEAIMTAVLEKMTTATDIYVSVKGTLIEKATNFNCTDVLSEKQCDLLVRIQARFHIRREEFQRVIATAVVSGIQTTQAIYDVTVGAFIEDAKNLTCSDMIDPQVCGILGALASNLGESIGDVTDAVRQAIAKGMTTKDEIVAFVKQLLVDEKSCYDFFGSRAICTSLRLAAWVKGVTFDRIVKRIRDLYANGVTSVRAILSKIKEIFGISVPSDRKRRALGIWENKDEIVDVAMQIISGIATVTDKMKAAIKREIKQLVDAGKMNMFNMYSKVKALIQKYNPLSDEFEDEVPSDMKRMSDIYKAARAALKSAVQRLVVVAQKAGFKADELMKMIQKIYQGGVADLDDIMTSSF